MKPKLLAVHWLRKLPDPPARVVVTAPPVRPFPATAWPQEQFRVVLPIVAGALAEGAGYYIRGSGGCVTHCLKFAPNGGRP